MESLQKILKIKIGILTEIILWDFILADEPTGALDSKTSTQIMDLLKQIIISDAILEEYEVVYGQMPKEYNEVVLILNKNNEIAATTMYELGLLPSSEYKDILNKINNNEEIELNTQKLSYEDICKQTLYYVANNFRKSRK